MIRHGLLPGLMLLQGATGSAWHTVLADMLDTPEDAMRLARTPRGKPVMSAPAGAGFSRSHRDGLLLLGAKQDAEVGVDLEVIRDDLPLLDIADTFFATSEAAWLRAAPARRAARFFALWTVKEAVLKATGQGITEGLPVPIRDLDELESNRPELLLGRHTVRLLSYPVDGRVVVAAIAVARQVPQPGQARTAG